MSIRSRFRAPSSSVVTALGLLAMAACADALSITPPTETNGEGGTSSVGGSGGSGGVGGMGCVSNSDCAAPTSVCDTVKATCVECLVLGDCGAQPGTTCSASQCVCANGGTWCAADACVDLMIDSANCGTCGHACFGGCVDGACTDAWEPLPTDGAPSPRSRHVAVWTGTHMLIWGGTSDNSTSNNTSTGAMYDPASFQWTTMSVVNAPSPRQNATAVWTGSQMIVWGGRDGATFLNDGGIFDPATNQWSPMSQAGAPVERDLHTAVWADTVGSMIVWGGRNTNELSSGGLYNPTTGWTATAAVPTPTASRRDHSAVWTGAEMVIYGGIGDTAAPVLNNTYWPASGVPGGRTYNPSTDSWDVTPNDPPSRASHTAVWTGAATLVFGGTNGANQINSGYKLETNVWSAFSGTPPAARSGHTSVWVETPGVMLVWGGQGETGRLNSGASYDPSANLWSDMPLATVLEARVEHTAVSTGDAMIIWGGADAANTRLQTGALYRP